MTADPLTLSVCLRARAKLNLRLEVLGRRPDGYHEVSTILHSLDLSDQVKLSLSCSDRSAAPLDSLAIELACRPDLGIPPQDNLAHRAAQALCNAWQAAGGTLPSGARLQIEIAKRIPIAAGLGGGSADAAAVLRGCSALFQAASGDPAATSGRINLLALAELLGSDVPFMVGGGAALGVGRGERLLPLPSSLTAPILLAVPSFSVAARQAYGWYDQLGPGEANPRPCNPTALHALADLAIPDSGWTHNDLTAPVAAKISLVPQLIDALLDVGAQVSGMTGSGPVVFGVFADASRAKQARHELERRYPHVRVLRSRLDPRPEPELAVTKEERE